MPPTTSWVMPRGAELPGDGNYHPARPETPRCAAMTRATTYQDSHRCPYQSDPENTPAGYPPLCTKHLAAARRGMIDLADGTTVRLRP